MRTERSAIHNAWQATFAHVADLAGVGVTAPGRSSLRLAAPVPLPESDSDHLPLRGSLPPAQPSLSRLSCQ